MRASEKNKENKLARVSFRITEKQNEALKTRIYNSGLTRSAFARRAVLNQVVKQRISTEELLVFKQLILLNNSVNQLVKAVHINGPYALLDSIESTIKILNKIIDKFK
jgi:hypothetical protein